MRLRYSSRNFVAPHWLRISSWRAPLALQRVTIEYVLVLSGTSFSFPPKLGAQVNSKKCTRQQLYCERLTAIFIVLAAGLRAVFCINERRTRRSDHARLGFAKILLDDTESILFRIGSMPTSSDSSTDAYRRSAHAKFVDSKTKYPLVVFKVRVNPCRGHPVRTPVLVATGSPTDSRLRLSELSSRRGFYCPSFNTLMKNFFEPMGQQQSSGFAHLSALCPSCGL